MKPIVRSLSVCAGKIDVEPVLTLHNAGLIFIRNRKNRTTLTLSMVLCQGILQYILQILNYIQPEGKIMFLVGSFSHIQQE